MMFTPENRNDCPKPNVSRTNLIRIWFILATVFAVFKAGGATNWYVSPDGNNSLASDHGRSHEKPLRTIAYAFNQAAEPGDTVFVMNGTYRNDGFGTGSINNGPVAFLNSSGTLHMPIVLTNMPGHQPIIEFDGAGGLTAGQIEHIEISGFTIIGPAEHITTEQAMAHRLDLPKPNYYNGRGIAIWGPASHVTIKHNTVSYAPGSGIRVNKGDYLNISHNLIFNNCWYTSAAESALVIAEAQSIDDLDSIKIIIENNQVWGNQNKIPFFTANPPSIGVPNYGAENQDYIIDGSGVYMTRNKEYETGWFYLANNISFNNGINGLVVHRTDRAIVVNNTSYMNGATPLESGRQSSSGITLNNASHVKVFNNISYARYPEDFALGQYGTLHDIELEANIIFNGFTPFDSGYLVANPLFVHADTIKQTADFSLQPNSPAINQGVLNQWVPPTDYLGNPRGDTPDIGALEYVDPVFLHKISIESIEARVFPNPAVDVVHIDLHNKHLNGMVSVWDIHGRQIYHTTLHAGEGNLAIDVSAWSRGVYLIKISSDTSHTTKKITVL